MLDGWFDQVTYVCRFQNRYLWSLILKFSNNAFEIAFEFWCIVRITTILPLLQAKLHFSLSVAFCSLTNFCFKNFISRFWEILYSYGLEYTFVCLETQIKSNVYKTFRRSPEHSYKFYLDCFPVRTTHLQQLKCNTLSSFEYANWIFHQYFSDSYC